MDPVSDSVRIPAWLSLILAASMAGGVALGVATGGARLPLQVARAVFFAAAFAYLVVSTVDFWEHFRLEKEATGRWLAWQAVPVGESINHSLTGLVLAALLLFVRPVSTEMGWRDWLTLVGPLVFLALGWWDELVFHRRRCAHREDIMHTVSHLAGGVMLVGVYLMRSLA